MPVSLRLPPAVVRRIAKLGETQDMTAHAFMLRAIQEKLDGKAVEWMEHVGDEQYKARLRAEKEPIGA